MESDKYIDKYKNEIEEAKLLYESGMKGASMSLISDIVQATIFERVLDEIPSREGE